MKNDAHFHEPAILIMKVGFHGHEELDAIIHRKQEEERLLGHTFWGYGGTLCHPVRSVQPFAESQRLAGRDVVVLFVVTPSPFFGDPAVAREYSVDGQSWEVLPSEARVTASKFALLLRELQACDEYVQLGSYQVANGPSAGKCLEGYLRFRVDKAVAVAGETGVSSDRVVKIAFKAKLKSPYAVFVR